MTLKRLNKAPKENIPSEQNKTDNLKHPDFRSMKEPARTASRLKYVLSNKDMTHGERSAAALLVLEFEGEDLNRKTIKIVDLLSQDKGYSSQIRTSVIHKMTNLNLINKKVLHKVGLDIEILF